MQLWGLGRAAHTPYLRERDPDFAYVSASDVPLPGRDEVPRPLTKDGARLSFSLPLFILLVRILLPPSVVLLSSSYNLPSFFSLASPPNRDTPNPKSLSL